MKPIKYYVYSLLLYGAEIKIMTTNKEWKLDFLN